MKAQLMNEFTKLLHDCGLSRKGVAMLLGKSPHTIQSYCLGRLKLNDGDLRKLNAFKAARFKIFINHE